VIPDRRPGIDDGHADSEAAAWLFSEIARRTRDGEGVSRPAFSDIETETLAFLEAFAQGEGLETWYDAGRNLVVGMPGERKASRHMLVGSHVDSVPCGGNFDGLAGVVAGIVCLLRALRTGDKFALPVRALAMRGEESAWFGPCYLASKALTGVVTAAELASRHKSDHRPLRDHMRDVGLPVDDLAAGRPLVPLDEIAAYIELHIEQGPLLVGKGIPAAVVTGIRGNFRHPAVRCIGEAGHSGAVPRAFRRDPVLAMADLLVRLDESWSTILNKGDDLVLTCGIVATDPSRHAMSRIPDEVTFSLDIRSQSAATLDEMRALLRSEMRQIERDRKVRFDLGEEVPTEPGICDPALVEGLKAAMARVGQEPFAMPSGGGHDAAVFAAAGVPSAMVFVRNEHGSHNPREAMEIDDFLAATDIVYEFLKAGP
jgi:N-carbamoyl-L-amino-acid hydrolase